MRFPSFLSVVAAFARFALFLVLLRATPTYCHREGDGDDYHSNGNVQQSFPLVDHNAATVIRDPIPYPLKELTLCHWVRFFNLTQQENTMFQYSVEGQRRAIATVATSTAVYFTVGTGDDYATTGPSKPRPGEWTHFCFTWSAYTGSVEIYRNGDAIGSNNNSTAQPVGHPIPPGGVAVLGGDQISPGVMGDAKYSLKGAISGLQLWNHVLCPDQIAALANCSSSSKRSRRFEGNVISWSTMKGFTEPLDINLCNREC